MNRARNEKCSRRRGGRSGGGCDAPIWVTREETYVAGREDRAICRARLRPGDGGGEKRIRVKHRKDVTRTWRGERERREREKSRRGGGARERASFTILCRRGKREGETKPLRPAVYCRRRRASARRPLFSFPAPAHAKAQMRNGVASRVRNRGVKCAEALHNMKLQKRD